MLLNELMLRHKEALFRFAFRMLRDEAVACDVVQETFVRAYFRAGKFAPRASVKTWLYSIAVNLVRDQVRRNVVRRNTVHLDDNHHVTGTVDENHGSGEMHAAGGHSHVAHGQETAPEGGTMPMQHGSMQMPENRFGPGNAMVAMSPVSRAHEPGTGLGEDGWRVLVYRDLIALDDRPMPAVNREITMNITGNMERFIWGFDGKKFSEAQPVQLRFGERVRITFVNHTMMEHPLHLHGMFMELENGAHGLLPLKHTVNVKPGEKISVLVNADARGYWAFHCHLLYHMEAGMFRVFEVA